ncbi:MAG: molybdopterin synthase catalytic subunit [Myxococcota bacterium]
MIAITETTIDTHAVEAAVSRPEAGAILTFSGATRDNFGGRPVTGLSYEVYEPMAISVMTQIAEEAAVRWPGARVAMVHRIGVLTIGEVSVVISVSTPHRADCYAASRFAIDALKERVPIWKKEHYADGNNAWKENQPS